MQGYFNFWKTTTVTGPGVTVLDEVELKHYGWHGTGALLSRPVTGRKKTGRRLFKSINPCADNSKGWSKTLVNSVLYKY